MLVETDRRCGTDVRDQNWCWSVQHLFQNKEERLEHLSQSITQALTQSCCCRRLNTLGREGRWTESNEISSNVLYVHTFITLSAIFTEHLKQIRRWLSGLFNNISPNVLYVHNFITLSAISIEHLKQIFRWLSGPFNKISPNVFYVHNFITLSAISIEHLKQIIRWLSGLFNAVQMCYHFYVHIICCLPSPIALI